MNDTDIFTKARLLKIIYSLAAVITFLLLSIFTYYMLKIDDQVEQQQKIVITQAEMTERLGTMTISLAGMTVRQEAMVAIQDKTIEQLRALESRMTKTETIIEYLKPTKEK